MIRSILFAGTVIAASIAPFSTPAAHAFGPCFTGFYCTFLYYSDSAHTPPYVGFTTINCQGQLSSGGRTTNWWTFTSKPCQE